MQDDEPIRCVLMYRKPTKIFIEHVPIEMFSEGSYTGARGTIEHSLNKTDASRKVLATQSLLSTVSHPGMARIAMRTLQATVCYSIQIKETME